MKKKVLTGAAIVLGVACILATLIFTLFDFKPREGEKESNALFCEYRCAGPEGELRVCLERKTGRTIRLTVEKTAGDESSTRDGYVPVGADGKLRELWTEYGVSAWGELSAAEETDGPSRSLHLRLGEKELLWDSGKALPAGGEGFIAAVRELLAEYAKEELW